MDSLFEIKLERAAEGARESSQTLYRELKKAILDGRLRAGTKLPATRRSDGIFGVSRNTALEVYERLLSEGYAVSRRGSGTYVTDPVSKSIAPKRARVSPSGKGLTPYRLNEFWLRPDVTAAMGFWRDDAERDAARGSEARQLSEPVARDSTLIDFRPALVDSRLFPFEIFRRVCGKQLRGLEKKPASYKSAQGNQGNYALREAITKHIALTRAVACQPEEIVVTSGAQQAFDLLARVLVTRGETVVAIEDPGYPPMRVPFAGAGAKLVPVGVDAEGLIVEQLPDDTGVICLCPSHQFPLGVTMSARRRRALIEFARRRGAVIIEDDYDGEFRYDGSPLEALRTADAADVVFYVGTFSKCMLPSLRLGFIIAPEWAMRTLIAAKNCLDWHCSTPLQMGVAAFISEGHLARHVRKMRQIYRERRQLLLARLQEDFAEWLEPIPSFYGMHVAVAARGSLNLDPLAESLLTRNVKIHTFQQILSGAVDPIGAHLRSWRGGPRGAEAGPAVAA